MSIDTLTSLETVVQAVTDAVTRPYQRRSGEWCVALDERAHAVVTLCEGWLTWTAKRPGGDDGDDAGYSAAPVSPWGVLLSHRDLALGLKWVAGDEGVVRLHADWPLADDCDVVRRLHEHRDAFLSALGLHGAAMPARHGESPSPADLVSLCRESGWAVATRADGVRVSAVTRRGAADVLVGSLPDGSVRVALECGRAPTLPDIVIGVLAPVLLAAAAQIRFVRPYADVVDDGVTAGFVVQLGAAPTAFEVSAALAAAATAFETCGPEVSALMTTDLGARWSALTAPTVGSVSR
ncbi:MAG: hypothetical protein AB7I50_01695 [Vicinamibacterales bacterium]